MNLLLKSTDNKIGAMEVCHPKPARLCCTTITYMLNDTLIRSIGTQKHFPYPTNLITFVQGRALWHTMQLTEQCNKKNESHDVVRESSNLSVACHWCFYSLDIKDNRYTVSNQDKCLSQKFSMNAELPLEVVLTPGGHVRHPKAWVVGISVYLLDRRV